MWSFQFVRCSLVSPLMSFSGVWRQCVVISLNDVRPHKPNIYCDRPDLTFRNFWASKSGGWSIWCSSGTSRLALSQFQSLKIRKWANLTRSGTSGDELWSSKVGKGSVGIGGRIVKLQSCERLDYSKQNKSLPIGTEECPFFMNHLTEHLKILGTA